MLWLLFLPSDAGQPGHLLQANLKIIEGFGFEYNSLGKSMSASTTDVTGPVQNQINTTSRIHLLQ